MSLEPNKLPLWQSVTEQNQKLKVYKEKALYKQHAHYNKFNPNYYPLVASINCSSIESNFIFPKILNKMHKRMCGKYK